MEIISQIITNSHKAQYESTKTTTAAFYTFNLVKELASPLYKEAIKYYKHVRTLDKKLKQIQNSVVADLENLFPSSYIIPSSSFTAKCNLSSDSDIDIYLYYNKPVDTKPLLDLKFIQKESPNPLYKLFNKMIDGVPIEVKVRNYKEAHIIRKLHIYLDTKLTTEERIYITYIKHKLVNNHAAYKAFKYLICNYCLYNMKIGKLF
jgi:hypothetical protein